MKSTLFFFSMATVIWLNNLDSNHSVLDQNRVLKSDILSVESNVLIQKEQSKIERKIFKSDLNSSKRKEQNITSLSVVLLAKENLGKPYVFGKAGPDSFDCSGFVYSMYGKIGLKIPRTSLAQSKIEGKVLTKEQLKIGDIVFFDTSLKGFVNHSGIYVGKNKFIHASSGKAYSVTISEMNGWYKDKFKWGKHLKK